MKESRSRNRSNIANGKNRKRILFIEVNPLFNRHDIIDRTLSTIRYVESISSIAIIYFDKRAKTYVIVEESIKYGSRRIRDDIRVLINKYLSTCIKTVILDEKATCDERSIVEADCYVAGLHSDLTPLIEEYILSAANNISKTKLSNIPYLSSQIPFIIDLYNSDRNHYIYITHI